MTCQRLALFTALLVSPFALAQNSQDQDPRSRGDDRGRKVVTVAFGTGDAGPVPVIPPLGRDVYYEGLSSIGPAPQVPPFAPVSSRRTASKLVHSWSPDAIW